MRRIAVFAGLAVGLAASLSSAPYGAPPRGEQEIMAEIVKSPTAALYAELGSLRARRNDLDSAEIDFLKAVTLDSRCAEAYAGLAGIGLKRKQFGQAREYAQIATALRPADAWYLSTLGRCDIALSRTDEAIRVLEKAIALKGKQTDWLYSLLAACYEQKKDYRRSAELILKQLGSRPWDDTIYVEAAKKYYQAGLTAEADRYRRMAGNAWLEYERLKALRDDRSRAWEHFKAGRYDEAFNLFVRLRDADPDKAYSWWAVGLTLQRMGDAESSREQYLKAVSLDPSFERAYSGLAGLSEDARDFPSAEAWYRKALEVKPHDPFATRDLMEVLMKQSRWNEAKLLAVELTQLDPGEDYHWSALGYITRRLSQDKESFDAYFQALLNSRSRKDKAKYLQKSVDAGLRACNRDPSLRPEVSRKLLRQMPADYPEAPVVRHLAEQAR